MRSRIAIDDLSAHCKSIFQSRVNLLEAPRSSREDDAWLPLLRVSNRYWCIGVVSTLVGSPEVTPHPTPPKHPTCSRLPGSALDQQLLPAHPYLHREAHSPLSNMPPPQSLVVCPRETLARHCKLMPGRPSSRCSSSSAYRACAWCNRKTRPRQNRHGERWPSS